KWQVISSKDLKSGVALSLPLPVIVKPNHEGSTIGITIVKEMKNLMPALVESEKHDAITLVEEFIFGKEITVGIVDGKPLPPLEIVPKSGFYDFQAKYTKGMTEYIVPARISKEAEREMTEMTFKVYRLLQLGGIARADFILGDLPYFLEVNSIPGMTETSLVPKAAAAVGMKTWWLWIGCGLIAALVFLPPIEPFQLREIVVVTPPTRISQNELVALAHVKKGENLLSLRLGEIRARLLKSPWIEGVALAKAYPGRLVISVQEQEPIALIKQDRFYLVNGKGEVFKPLEGKDPKNFPLISGLKKPKKEELAPLIDLIHLFYGQEALRPVGLSEIQWTREKGVSLFTVRPVLKVVLGKDRWTERLERLAHIVPEVSAKRGAPVLIDLTFDKRVFIKRG
ncbi:MAG: FtsQ-type POTRA domain-containing protein, partial [Deltaproteobacteria bacterium]|nr:FtsQ-type POTRA domain-containing protein [Deltaproteobacteria bacterium]